MSLFSVVQDVTISYSKFNSDSAKISDRAFKWKMSFNRDPTKPAQEVNFSRKLKTDLHPSITFNNNPLSPCPPRKHLRLVLDSKLTFNEHINHIFYKVNKSLPKFQLVLLRSPLLTIYNTFICSHFNYADVVYDQSYKSAVSQKT